MVSKNSDSRDGDYGDSLIAKITGFAQGTSDSDVKTFLSGVEIEEISVQGTSATFKCKNLKSVNAALTFDEKDLSGAIVTVRRCSGDTPLQQEQGALRCKNWPWRISDEDFQAFFEGHNVVPGSVKFHVNEEGRKSGEAAVLFQTEDDADKALDELQGQDIGGRQARLFDLDVDEYNDFENWDPSAKDVRCGDSVSEDNVDRCVKLRGLPWTVNKKIITNFFEGFTLKKKNITIDVQGGRCSGFAIVELDDEDEAARAIEELDRKEIGTRWVGVSAAQCR